MSNSIKNKILFLLIGLIFGFFIGSVIVWYKLTGSIDNMSTLYKGMIFEKNKDQMKTLVANDNISKKQQLKNSYIPNKYLKDDNNETYSDSSFSNENSINEEDDIVVAQDELISAKRFAIDGTPKTNSNKKNLDSLLVDDVNTSSNKNTEGNLLIEFWKSPINFKGYKFDDKKLVIFGYGDYEVQKVFNYNNELFLKCRNEFFKLTPDENFKTFIPVKNTELLRKLNTP